MRQQASLRSGGSGAPPAVGNCRFKLIPGVGNVILHSVLYSEHSSFRYGHTTRCHALSTARTVPVSRTKNSQQKRNTCAHTRRELCEFVRWLEPGSIIPSVSNDNGVRRDQMLAWLRNPPPRPNSNQRGIAQFLTRQQRGSKSAD
jgi:hypothetical protein